MKKIHSLSLFIFRRDLRLMDNTALIEAFEKSERVICIFIFDPRQMETHRYLSLPALQFMLNSLKELEQEIEKQKGRLYFFSEIAEELIPKLCLQLNIDAVFMNRDYTPFSKKRDTGIAEFCRKNQRHFYSFDDSVLHKPESLLKSNGEPYTIYTPYMRKAKTLAINLPRKIPHSDYFTENINGSHPVPESLFPNLQNLILHGGRKEGLRLLNRTDALEHYSENRNFPAKNATSHLSAHIKFGTVSIRECHAHISATLSPEHTLINELYWHDFFTQIGYFFPKVFGFAFYEKYQKIPWKNNKSQFDRWCEGQTGFPIIDAGMRELNATGYMHNRVRMIVASFLTKDLLINWRWGEAYFARKLIDYDPCVNNGNWQWAASTGCDAQPYFRIFNPWLQQKKFDEETLYIKKWVPELSDLPTKVIHNLFSLEKSPIKNYPSPMVDHAQASSEALQIYKSSLTFKK